MLIENEMKLDYKDVLFRPKRSTLKSRQEVDLFRKIEFSNAKGQDSGPVQETTEEAEQPEK